MTYIQKIVQREDWQKLRISFLATWKKCPSENVFKLRMWLGKIEKCEYEKLRIVLNYLTGSGFRMRVISDAEIDMLLADIRIELDRRGCYTNKIER